MESEKYMKLIFGDKLSRSKKDLCIHACQLKGSSTS